MSDHAWEAIFEKYDIHNHKFGKDPFIITANEIKEATTHFTATKEREPRILCKHDTRETRPTLFQEKNLFLLAIKNGTYAIVQGEGYVDIPIPENDAEDYKSQLDFHLETALVSDSEMQHLDFAFAIGLIQKFVKQSKLFMTLCKQKVNLTTDFLVQNQLVQIENVKTTLGVVYESENNLYNCNYWRNSERTRHIQDFLYPVLYLQQNISKNLFVIGIQSISNVYKLWLWQILSPVITKNVKLIRTKAYIARQSPT